METIKLHWVQLPDGETGLRLESASPFGEIDTRKPKGHSSFEIIKNNERQVTRRMIRMLEEAGIKVKSMSTVDDTFLIYTDHGKITITLNSSSAKGGYLNCYYEDDKYFCGGYKFEDLIKEMKPLPEPDPLPEKKTALTWEDPRICMIGEYWTAIWTANTPIGEFIIESRIELSKDFTIKLEDCFLDKSDSHWESVEYCERYMAKIRDQINKAYE